MQQQQFIDLQDQLNVFRAIFCPSSGASEGFGERQRAALRTPAYHHNRTL